MDQFEWLAQIVIAFDEMKNPNKALQMKAYMKDRFEYFGITAPERRAWVKEMGPKPKFKDSAQVIEFLNKAWSYDQREIQYVAIDLTRQYVKLIEVNALESLEALICSKSWWDTVDSLAPIFMYQILKTDQNLAYTTTEKWIESDNLWLQRSAIIFQLRARKLTDKALLERNILALSDHKDFFIRKAIGWSLREYSKFDPDFTLSFIDKHESVLSNLSKKEALKHFN